MARSARLLTAAVAAAAAIAAPSAAAQDVPQGILAANGAGTFILDGDAAVLGMVRGPAVILVQDRAGDVRFRVGGKIVRPLRTRPAPPFVTVRRFRIGNVRRRFLVTGSNMRIRVDSREMTVNASGRFKVRLNGQGSYTVNDGRPQAWVAGAVVRVGLTRQRRARG